MPLAAHAELSDATTRPDPVATLGAQDTSRLSELVPIRYGRMVATPFTFLRGAAAVMAADLGGTPRTDLEVQLCGDAHVANFGAFSAPDRRLVVDVNDFDETLPGPFEWDVKRLAASLVVAGRNNGLDAEQTRSVAAATVEVYRTALAFAAVTDPLDVWYSRVEVDDLAKVARGSERKGLEKLIRQAVTKANRKDRVRAAAKLTEVVDGHRIIAADPPLIVRPEPDLLAAELESIVTFLDGLSCRASPATASTSSTRTRSSTSPTRSSVSGASARRCWILLLESGDGEPLFLQFKEATTSVLEPHLGPSEFENSGQRVVEGQQLVQAAQRRRSSAGRVTRNRADGGTPTTTSASSGTGSTRHRSMRWARSGCGATDGSVVSCWRGPTPDRVTPRASAATSATTTPSIAPSPRSRRPTPTARGQTMLGSSPPIDDDEVEANTDH